jgi:hypothetical protein
MGDVGLKFKIIPDDGLILLGISLLLIVVGAVATGWWTFH